MILQFRIIALQIGDPGRAAGGHHGQNTALGDAADQLSTFLHDGQVSSEIGVVNIVEADAAQGGSHLTGSQSAQRRTEVFGDSHTDGGCALDHGDGIGIGQRSFDFIDVADVVGGEQRLLNSLRQIPFGTNLLVSTNTMGDQRNIGFALLHALATHNTLVGIDDLGLTLDTFNSTHR